MTLPILSHKDSDGVRVQEIRVADLHRYDIIILETDFGVKKIVIIGEPANCEYCEIGIDRLGYGREPVNFYGMGIAKFTINRKLVIHPSSNVSLELYCRVRRSKKYVVRGYEIIEGIGAIRLIRAGA